MFKKIIFNVILLLLFITTQVNATTIIAVICDSKIVLASDTRFTIIKEDGEKVYNDDGKKIYKLKNDVLVAFAGDTNSIKKIKCGREIITKSVKTIINDINDMEELKELTVTDIAEIVAEKYVNLLVDYSGDIIVAGFEDDTPLIYGIKASKGRAMWQGISGKGSFWAIGSGGEKIVETLKCNLALEDSTIIERFTLMKDREIIDIVEKSLHDVIIDYENNYEIDDRSTGGHIDMVIIKK